MTKTFACLLQDFPKARNMGLWWQWDFDKTKSWPQLSGLGTPVYCFRVPLGHLSVRNLGNARRGNTYACVLQSQGELGGGLVVVF